MSDGFYPAVRLTREGNHAVVSVETPRGFIVVIRESLAGWPEVEFDHIVNPSGIQVAIDRAALKAGE